MWMTFRVFHRPSFHEEHSTGFALGGTTRPEQPSHRVDADSNYFIETSSANRIAHFGECFKITTLNLMRKERAKRAKAVSLKPGFAANYVFNCLMQQDWFCDLDHR
jgi:hypothetical protein